MYQSVLGGLSKGGLKNIWTTIWAKVGICENCGHPSILEFYGISIGSDCPCCRNGVCLPVCTTYLFDIPHRFRTCKNNPETCERTYTHSLDIVGLNRLVEMGFDRTDAISAMIDGKNKWKEAEAILKGKTVSAESFVPEFFLKSDKLNIFISLISSPQSQQNMNNISSSPHSLPNMNNIPSSPHSFPNMNNIPSSPHSLPNMNNIPSSPRSFPNMNNIPSSPHSFPNMNNIPSSPRSFPNMNNIPSSPRSFPNMNNIPLPLSDTATPSTRKPVNSWTTPDVQKWIYSLGPNWDQVVGFFAFIDGSTLLELSYDDLIRMKIPEIQAVPLFIKIRNLKQQSTVTSSSLTSLSWNSDPTYMSIPRNSGNGLPFVSSNATTTSGNGLPFVSSNATTTSGNGLPFVSSNATTTSGNGLPFVSSNATTMSGNGYLFVSSNATTTSGNGLPFVSSNATATSRNGLPFVSSNATTTSRNGLPFVSSNVMTTSGNGLQSVSFNPSYISPPQNSYMNLDPQPSSKVPIQHNELKKYYIDPSILDIPAGDDNCIGYGAFSKVVLSSLKSKNFPIRYSAVCEIKNLKIIQSFEPVSLASWQIKNMGILIHPNIIKLYGYTMKDNNLIIITEYMEKGSLNDNLKNLDNEMVLMLAKQIVEGMVFMYQKGIFHRDLTVNNILLTGHKRRLVAKVAGFGLSKVIGLNDHDDVMGPVRYMAPEVLDSNGQDFTEKSDVYSFGMILWSMFAKVAKPFEEYEDDLNNIRNAIIQGKRPDIPEGCFLASLIEACFDAEPYKRPTFEMIKNYLMSNFA